MTSMKQVAASGGLKIGTFLCEFATPGIGYILKNAGLDFVFLDMEHSGFDVSQMKSALRYFEAADLPCLVRPPGKGYYDMARMLDIGAGALCLPMVSSAAEAHNIVRQCKYVPSGERGVALGIMHDRYTTGPVMQKLREANRETAIFPLIETAAGLAEVEDIAKVEGVDGLWLGHFDLSCSMGIPGEFENPVFIAAVARVSAAAKAAGIPVGRIVADAKEGMAEHANGYGLIAISGDVWMLQNAFAKAANDLRLGVSG
jgi:2-keto-3-deoxy-L-rhamnonate aldolase RhmA